MSDDAENDAINRGTAGRVVVVTIGRVLLLKLITVIVARVVTMATEVTTVVGTLRHMVIVLRVVIVVRVRAVVIVAVSRLNWDFLPLLRHLKRHRRSHTGCKPTASRHGCCHWLLESNRVPKRDVILTGSVVKSNGVRPRVGSRVGYALLSFTRNCTHNCMDLFSDLMG